MGSGGACESGAAPEMGVDSGAPEISEDSLAGVSLRSRPRAPAGDLFVVQQKGLPALPVGALLIPARGLQRPRQTLRSVPATASAKLDRVFSLCETHSGQLDEHAEQSAQNAAAALRACPCGRCASHTGSELGADCSSDAFRAAGVAAGSRAVRRVCRCHVSYKAS